MWRPAATLTGRLTMGPGTYINGDFKGRRIGELGTRSSGPQKYALEGRYPPSDLVRFD